MDKTLNVKRQQRLRTYGKNKILIRKQGHLEDILSFSSWNVNAPAWILNVIYFSS